MSHRLRRGLRRLTWGSLLLLLALALMTGGVIGYALNSPWAARQIWSLTQPLVPELEIDALSGTLWSGLHAERLHWQGETFSVSAEDLSARADPACLLRARLCLESVTSARLRLHAAGDDAPFAGVRPGTVTLPFFLSVRSLDVRELTWQSGNQPPLALGQWQLRGQWFGQKLTLAEVRWQTDNATLGKADLTLTGDLRMHRTWPINATLEGRWQPADIDLPFDRYQLRLSGTLDALNADLRVADRGEITARIDLSRPELPFRLETRALPTLQHEGFRLRDTTLRLEGALLKDFGIEASSQVDAPGQPAARLRLKGHTDLRSLTVAPLTLQLPEGVLTLTGRLNREGRTLSWAGDLKVQNLNPALWLAELPGTLSGSARVQAAFANRDWRLDARDVRLAGTLREKPFGFSGALARSTGGVWSLQKTDIRWGDNRTQLAGTLNHRWDLRGEASLPRLDTLWPGLSGDLSGRWQLSGPLRDPVVSVDLHSQTLGWQNYQVQDLRLKTSGTRAAHTLALALTQAGTGITLNVTGALREDDLRWTGTLSHLMLTQGDLQAAQTAPTALSLLLSPEQHTLTRVTAGELCLASDSTRVCMAGTYDVADQALDGTLTLTQLDLARLAALLHPDDKPAAYLSGMADARLKLNGPVSHLRPEGWIDVRDGAFALPDQPLSRISDLNGRLDLVPGEATLSLRFSTWPTLTWQPDAPLRLSWTDAGEARIQPACWTAGKHHLCVEGSARGIAADAEARLTLTGPTAPLLASQLPPGLTASGMLNVTLALERRQGQPWRARTSAELDSVQITLDRRDDPPLVLDIRHIAATAEREDGTIRGQVVMESDRLGALNARLDMPVTVPEALRGEFRLDDFSLQVLHPFFPRLNVLEGRVAAEGTWQGVWPLNDVNAAIRLSDGRVASPTLPVGLEAVNLTLNVTQDTLALNGEARSGKGQLQLSGSGALGPDWHMQVQLNGQDVDVRQPPRLTARVDPALTLTATAETVVLSGRLDVTDGLLRLDQNPDRVDLSPDIVVVRQAVSDEAPEDKGPDFLATVILNVVKPFSVQGYGADLKLKGNVTLLQMPDSVPSGYGTLTLTEGRFEKYGQKLQLRSGQVQFSGPVTDPWIRLEAIREVPPVVAGIRLEGPASAPVATPFSEPALPPDHVMYYLLTGRPPGDNTASEKAMVSRAMLSIGLYGATPLTQKMADIFGIEGFGIETTGQGDDTAISISGYLSPRLYVEYGFGVFTPVNTLTTRYRLSKNLYLEAVSGVENLLNVLYRFEF